MTTKHTPGPWKAVNCGAHWNNPSITDWQIHWSEHGECVADTVYEEADALLMAAAPELLEALKALVAAQGMKPAYRAASAEMARSAIARAEGVQ